MKKITAILFAISFILGALYIWFSKSNWGKKVMAFLTVYQWDSLLHFTHGLSSFSEKEQRVLKRKLLEYSYDDIEKLFWWSVQLRRFQKRKKNLEKAIDIAYKLRQHPFYKSTMRGSKLETLLHNFLFV